LSLVLWVIVGWAVGWAGAKALPEAERPRRRLGFAIAGIAGSLAGGLISSAAGLGSTTQLIAPGTWLRALIGAVLSISIYQSAVD
jgi:uncharacterized membrane protein YeaQ/YmgE (transglycosylase-associated protein family)